MEPLPAHVGHGLKCFNIRLPYEKMCSREHDTGNPHNDYTCANDARDDVLNYVGVAKSHLSRSGVS